jgi:hypothetical protein
MERSDIDATKEHPQGEREGRRERVKSVTVFAKLAVIERSEHLGDGLLDHAIQHRRNSEGSL